MPGIWCPVYGRVITVTSTAELCDRPLRWEVVGAWAWLRTVAAQQCSMREGRQRVGRQTDDQGTFCVWLARLRQEEKPGPLRTLVPRVRQLLSRPTLAAGSGPVRGVP